MHQLSESVQRSQIIQAMNKQDYPTAFRLGMPLLKKYPHDLHMSETVATAAVEVSNLSVAVQLLKKIIKQQPKNSRALLQLGFINSRQGNLDEAVRYYDRAMPLLDDPRPAISGKAGIHERRGEKAETRALLQPYIDEGTASPAMVNMYATLLQSEGKHRESIPLILEQLSDPTIPLGTRGSLAALAAKAYEKTSEFDKAFEAFVLSNKAMERPFSEKEYIAGIDALINTFTRENLEHLPRGRNRSELPVFVACMPRSGSTLAEQIMHAHPQLHGAGEITEFYRTATTLPHRLQSMQPYPSCLGDLTQTYADELGQQYLDGLRVYHPRATRIVNKHLENWNELGMVELLLPGARVVNTTRNPIDNCFSIFMAAMGPDMYPWAWDLRSIGVVYRQYERLMEHWRSVLEVPILEVPYEQVVENTDHWVRTIIDFLGVSWDERCLRYYEAERDVMTLSYDQVRRPIYKTAVKRYERYLEFLGPLLDTLGYSRSGERIGSS